MKLKSTSFAFGITILFFLLAYCFFTNCSRLKNKPDQKALEEIVLKIGEYEITRYEFEKQWNNQINSPNKIAKQDWLSTYLNRSYITADAYQKKYDTSSIVKLKNYYTQLNMCSSVGEYYWNKIEEPKLQFTNKEIKSAYKRRDKLYYLDYFVFADKHSMLSVLEDTVIKNENEFTKIALACRGKNNIRIASEPLSWPFKYLGDFKEIIYQLKPGEITKPLYGPKYIFIVKLNKIETQKLPSYQNVKEVIEKELRNCKADNIINKKQTEILGHAYIQINENTIYEVLSETNKINQTHFDTTRHLIVNNKVLATFNIGNEKQQLSIGDFLNYYHFYPLIKPVIKDKQGIYATLNFLILQKSLYAEALQLGVLNEKGFLLDMKIHTEQYIEDAYYKGEIENHITVTEAEKRDHYEKNKQSFEQVSECNVYLFKFADRQSLENSWQYLAGQFTQGNLNKLTDPLYVKGLVSFLPNAIVKKDDKLYPPKLIHAISNQPVNQLSPPFLDFDGVYYAFYKMQEGEKTIQPFEEVKDILFHQVRMMKIHLLENKRVEELKQKYNITINKTTLNI